MDIPIQKPYSNYRSTKTEPKYNKLAVFTPPLINEIHVYNKTFY
jgi:hypothetical protein